MAEKYMSMENIKFLLYNVHNLESLFTHDRFKEYNRESIDMMMDAAKDYGDKELLPYLEEMDRQGCVYENGEVTIPPQIAKVFSYFGETGWINATESYDHGGMQLPHMVHHAGGFIYAAANNSAIGYSTLAGGAANLIVSFGSEEQFQKYVKKMWEGKWQGTMALTEPDAGSSLSDITTTAKRQEDGKFKITGQKIFISGGDYKEADNVIHLMLARIEGAPKGARGISLFIVPKRRIDEDGSLQANDVTTAGIFHKMGQRAYVTTHLIMGEKDDCIGHLVGSENLGLKYMFQMMNAARIEVGLTGAAIASAAYYASLEYAQERSQGRLPSSKDPIEPPTSILNHADVRRMLFFQKAIVEGSISLVLECSKLIDLIDVSDEKEKEDYQLLLEILTPIVKTYPSEMGIQSVSTGLQCLGGYGFCVDFPLEQFHRDIRITTLYEGTTGIQSLDLLGRKMMMQDGKAAKLLFGEISKTLNEAKEFEKSKRHAISLFNTLNDFQQVLNRLIGLAVKGQTNEFLADANLFMELSGIIVIGWQWIKQGIAAEKALKSGDGDAKYFESKIKTMDYYFAYELPKSKGLVTRLMDTEIITIKGDNEYLV
ncbi:MAG: acyl-CoA dehydrogenase [Cytophagales bacterium]|nr:acyl-CoA dehydrogenase [Cytophagales bacterium]